MLLERGLAADRQRGTAILDESIIAAQKMGMAYLAEKAAGLQARYNLRSG